MSGMGSAIPGRGGLATWLYEQDGRVHRDIRRRRQVASTTPDAQAGFTGAQWRRTAVVVVVSLIGALLPSFPIAEAGTIPETSTITVIEPGAYIIDMGVVPQTVDSALKPYGLVYELMISE
ncbi:MAG: hypothetical protein PVF87_12015, partial [Acidimicrobiia bacterium]